MQKDIEKIANHFGLDHQMLKLQEEMSELSIAITKLKTEGITDKTISNLIEETVDVEIMIEEVKYLLSECGGITNGLFEIQKEYKIARTLERCELDGL